ncbi:Actin-related protein 2/3 complex subunit 2A [Capsicum baccatum]|uniref:Actin-related protein 2/3 complex subunit 2A n=1 Tax=Capsicum baccatum TaxID=33114 RepID=A0A2G2WS67_CAPBA|nr:Actin-related protein 2/3 complex subunit 2A [Capsicum baccatum]
MINPRKIMEKWKPQCIDKLPEAFYEQKHALLTKIASVREVVMGAPLRIVLKQLVIRTVPSDLGKPIALVHRLGESFFHVSQLGFHRKARILECVIGIKVIKHGVKKPAGTAEEIEKQFGCESSRLIMVGDRPFTDIVYGNRNGFLTILTEPLRCAEEPLIVQQGKLSLDGQVKSRLGKKGAFSQLEKVKTDGDVFSGKEVPYTFSTRNEISSHTFARIRPPQNCRGTHRLEQKYFATSDVDFLHRVGRTARAGQPGIVTSRYKESNCDHVTAIMDETSISCIDERHAHLMWDPSYESFRKHGSDLI